MEPIRTSMRRAAFTRPSNTTNYTKDDAMGKGSAALDCIMEFPKPMASAGRTGKIVTSRLWKDDTGVTNDSFRLLLFQKLPASDPDDNVGPSTSFIKDADAGFYIGQIDYETSFVGADAVHYEGQDLVPSSGIPFQSQDRNGGIYGILTALAAYNPASGEIFTITLEIQE